jgi:hypothetical protein
VAGSILPVSLSHSAFNNLMEGLAGVAIATSPPTMAYKDVPMSIKVDVSQEIDRPVADVFRLFAEQHVHNHPRWDPFMRLEQLGDSRHG